MSRATSAFRQALALVVALACAASAQPRHCDPDLPVSTDNPLGYRLRGDRCEGVYIQEVSATPLTVVSFGEIEVTGEPDGGPLRVEWAAAPPGAGDIRLRASSTRPRTYYRMDRRQLATAAAFNWPTDVVAALRLPWEDIGVVAITTHRIGPAIRDLHLPVRIGRTSPGREGTYELQVVPGAELSEVFVGVAPVGPDGVPAPVDPQPLEYGYYPAGRSIRIPVGPLPQPGTYYVEIGATLRGGGAVGQEVWFTR